MCGPKSVFSVVMQITLDDKDTASLMATSSSLPIELKNADSDPSCTLQDDISLPILGSKLTVYDATTKLWTLHVNCSLPETTDDDKPIMSVLESKSEFNFECELAANAVAVPVNIALRAFQYFSSKYSINNITLANSGTNGAQHPSPVAPVKPKTSRMIGIGRAAHFNIHVSDDSGANTSASAARQSTMSGICEVNGQNTTVKSGSFDYIVQKNDSDVAGLKYVCTLIDGAGNTLYQNGMIHSNTLQIDGSEPVLDEVFMLFSTDKPAKIGSVISITLRSKNLRNGYTGACEVNGVKGLALISAEDDGFYMTQYTVASGDRSMDEGSTVKLECTVLNQAGNTYRYKEDLQLDFAIDAEGPVIVSTGILFSSDRPAHEGSIIEIQISLKDDEPHLHIAKNQSCLVNNVSVDHSFTQSSANSFLITYMVGKGQAHWKAGALPIHCVIQDAAGNTAVVDHFTDQNTLFARELKPVELEADDVISWDYFPDKLLIISFLIVAIASHTISKVCPHIGLPRITGYIITGILVGPYVLNFLSAVEVRKLRVIDELSLAYIGLTAGSKLHWKIMKPIMKSIVTVTVGLTVIEYIVGTLTIAVLAGYIDFLQDTSSSEKYAIALLAGCMMIARSPSSALAVIEETKSQGHFTTLVFAVTVMCDVIVIFLFNVNSMITESFLSEKQMSSSDLLRLILQLCGSIGVGLVFGKIMAVIILWRHRSIKRKSTLLVLQQVFKQFLILFYGWMVFVVSHLVHPYLEPLLCCMVSGAVMWNTSPNPEELGILLKRLADLVYVCFFTITGATLELDMVVKALVLSIVLCLTRIAAIFLGSFLGGVCAGEDRGHSKVAWMAYITQAGVTLGLAKQIQLLYPGWGSYFSTMIVAVVICNQLIGPPLLRYVLRLVGDAKKKEIGKVDGLTAVVLSIGLNSIGAISRLEMCGWSVTSHLLESESDEMRLAKGVFADYALREVLEVLKITKPLDVVVVMMPTNDENFQVIRAITQACQKLRRLRVLRVVVQIVSDGNDDDDTNWGSRFAEMPTTEEHGDTIDVVVVDRNEATDMLIELAACGKVVNTSMIMANDSSNTAIAMEEGVAETTETSDTALPARARLRQKLTKTVNRMMLV
uniref:Cation/H+ exchanger transmembrane domain-containing protein n=1 Tax=Globisporangium ultimum (strain ATCC 200006 / CBS 805.95 / DAOM BR144) TaxID=431595 RepID=K3X313_GLOUD